MRAKWQRINRLTRDLKVEFCVMVLHFIATRGDTPWWIDLKSPWWGLLEIFCGLVGTVFIVALFSAAHKYSDEEANGATKNGEAPKYPWEDDIFEDSRTKWRRRISDFLLNVEICITCLVAVVLVVIALVLLCICCMSCNGAPVTLGFSIDIIWTLRKRLKSEKETAPSSKGGE